MHTLAEPRIYEFEGFRLDARIRRLSRSADGDDVPLTPRVAELLIFMIENAGRMIPKDELFEAVWENLFVEEANLSQSVFVLRKALGDDTKHPRFILTAPNRGYQFIAPVSELDSEEDGFHRVERRGTANSDAYQAYVLGRFFWNKRTGVSLKKAVVHFEQAIEQDPNFAQAYMGLANSYQLLAEYYAAATPNESPSTADATLNKAMAIDEKLAEAHAGLAYAQAFYDWDWERAETSFKHALELNPNYATAHQWYADYLGVMGRFDESLKHIERAIEIDPFSPIIAAGLAAFYYTGRQWDRLIEQSTKVIELDPNFAYGYFYLGFGYEFKGMNAEAVEAFAKTAVLFGEPPDCADELKEAFKQKGTTGLWQKRLLQYEERPHLKNHPTYLRSLIPIRLGDTEATLALLERAFQQRDRGIIYAKHEPLLEPLRQDPRFQDLLQRMGL